MAADSWASLVRLIWRARNRLVALRLKRLGIGVGGGGWGGVVVW